VGEVVGDEVDDSPILSTLFSHVKLGNNMFLKFLRKIILTNGIVIISDKATISVL